MACEIAYYIPVFQVKHRDWWHGAHDPAIHLGHASSPHFWTVAGCLGDGPMPGPSGSAIPASSQSVASTDLVTLLRRTMHWTARTWNPLPPQVCEHFDQGVRSHSNFKLSAFPVVYTEKKKRKKDDNERAVMSNDASLKDRLSAGRYTSSVNLSAANSLSHAFAPSLRNK